jgi:hypothetical protein
MELGLVRQYPTFSYAKSELYRCQLGYRSGRSPGWHVHCSTGILSYLWTLYEDSVSGRLLLEYGGYF